MNEACTATELTWRWQHRTCWFRASGRPKMAWIAKCTPVLYNCCEAMKQRSKLALIHCACCEGSGAVGYIAGSVRKIAKSGYQRHVWLSVRLQGTARLLRHGF